MIRFWHYFYLFVKFLTSLFSKYLSFKLHPEILTVAVTAAKIHCPLLFCFVCLFFFFGVAFYFLSCSPASNVKNLDFQIIASAKLHFDLAVK